MTREELERLRALEANASPGPWTGDGSKVTALIPEGEPHAGAVWPVCSEIYNEDAALIAEMRNALPRLLDEVEAAREVVEAARAMPVSSTHSRHCFSLEDDHGNCNCGAEQAAALCGAIEDYDAQRGGT